MEYLQDKKVHIAFFQETWLNNGDKSICEQIKNDYNFKVINRMRKKGRGGGLAILAGSEIELKRSFNISKEYTTFEFTSGVFIYDKKKILFINLYRRPYCNQHRCTKVMVLISLKIFLLIYHNIMNTYFS